MGGAGGDDYRAAAAAAADLLLLLPPPLRRRRLWLLWLLLLLSIMKCNIQVQLFKWMLSTTDREISRSLSSIFDATTARQFGQERAVLLYLR
jgi:hypothetical protein